MKSEEINNLIFDKVCSIIPASRCMASNSICIVDTERHTYALCAGKWQVCGEIAKHMSKNDEEALCREINHRASKVVMEISYAVMKDGGKLYDTYI